jgi:hexosaminidase
MVVPEIDIPGHASALLSVYPGGKWSTLLLLDEDLEFMIRHSTLRILNISLLGEIFDEVCPLFTSNYFHIGGDENNGKEGMQILPFNNLRKKKITSNHDLQNLF